MENDKKSQQELIENRLKNTFHAVANEWLSRRSVRLRLMRTSRFLLMLLQEVMLMP